MNDRERIIKAASDIETLSAYMKELVTELRDGQDIATAYARIYWLRTDLGRIVGRLGVGLPVRSRTRARPLNLVNRQ